MDQQLSGIRYLALGQSAHCLPQKTGPRNKSSHFLSLVQSLIVFRLMLTQAVSICQLILVCVQNCEVLALAGFLKEDWFCFLVNITLADIFVCSNRCGHAATGIWWVVGSQECWSATTMLPTKGLQARCISLYWDWHPYLDVSGFIPTFVLRDFIAASTSSNSQFFSWKTLATSRVSQGDVDYEKTTGFGIRRPGRCSPRRQCGLSLSLAMLD